MVAPKVDTTRNKGALVLKLLSDKVSDCRTYYTQDDWHIESDYLITYDVVGSKLAHKIPQTIHSIIEGSVPYDNNEKLPESTVVSGSALGS